MTPIRHVNLRFKSNSSSSIQITDYGLVMAAGSICTTSNATLVAIYKSVRLRRVRVWSPPASQGEDGAINLGWTPITGQSIAANGLVNDASPNPAAPAYIDARPPGNAFASMWRDGTPSTNLFQLSCTIGSVIDLEVDCILNTTQAIGPTLSITTGTGGILYWPALDCDGSDHYTPYGRPTTT
jgi:hypothetical protein